MSTLLVQMKADVAHLPQCGRMRGDKAANQFAVFYLKDGVVVAADAVNSPKEFMLCKQMIGKPVDAAKLADPAQDLKSLVA